MAYIHVGTKYIKRPWKFENFLEFWCTLMYPYVTHIFGKLSPCSFEEKMLRRGDFSKKRNFWPWPMKTPKCYTWLESCGSPLSDGIKKQIFVHPAERAIFYDGPHRYFPLYWEAVIYVVWLNYECIVLNCWIGDSLHFWFFLRNIHLFELEIYFFNWKPIWRWKQKFLLAPKASEASWGLLFQTRGSKWLLLCERKRLL